MMAELSVMTAAAAAAADDDDDVIKHDHYVAGSAWHQRTEGRQR